MSKPRRNPNLIEQYDRFMMGNKAPTIYRPLNIVGAYVGNTAAGLLRLMTVANLGLVLAFVLVAAVTIGVLQRTTPTLELVIQLIISSVVALIVVGIGVLILKRALRRDAQHIGQKPIFGIYDEDARDFRANRRKPRR